MKGLRIILIINKVPSDPFIDKKQMKHLLFLISLFVFGNSYAQEFITTWRTTTANESITIPTRIGYPYNYTIDWGDGSATTTHTTAASPSHTYTMSGDYTVKINATQFPSIFFNNTGDKDKIISIDQWGNIEWRALDGAFYGCSNLEGKASDIPNISLVTSLVQMFAGTTKFNQDLSAWDVSLVTKMASMFEDASGFDNGSSPLNWANKTAKVTNLSGMFNGAINFNEDISSWNIGSLTDAIRMFNNSALTPDNYDKLLISWQGQAHNKNIVFWAGGSRYCSKEAKEARGKLMNADAWNIRDYGVSPDPSCVQPNTTDFSTMWETTVSDLTITIPTFPGETYNYTIEWGDGYIDKNVTGDATHTYNASRQFDVRISGDFPRIYFNNSGDKAKIVSINQWGNIKWSSMENSFYGCINMEGKAIDRPDLSNVDHLDGMFNGAVKFDQDIGMWAVDNVVSAVDMFKGVKLSTSNYDALLIGWNSQSLNSGVVFSGGDSQYCQGKPSRATMISMDSWTITDGGEEAGCLITVDCPRLIYPLDNTFDVSVNPTIKWEAVTGATGYRISIGEASQGTNILNKEDVSNQLEYTLTSNLEEGVTYYLTVYAYDAAGESTGCTEVVFTTESTFDIPQFFTPNNDGVNDYWEIVDDSKAIEYIFIMDRYGKALRRLTSTQKWDGSYKGNPLDETDYWYIVKLKSGRQLTGHFSLIRK